MHDFFFAFWPTFQQRQTAFEVDVEDFIRICGVDAYQVACRRRVEANDLSGALYWERVKAEIDRRSGGRSCALDDFGPDLWDRPADARAEARRLALGIEHAQWIGVENRPEGERFEARRLSPPTVVRISGANGSQVGNVENRQSNGPTVCDRKGKPPRSIAGQRLQLRVVETS